MISLKKTNEMFCRKAGLSLIELLTTIVIMGILTTAAIPLGEVVFIRDKEDELKETLMSTREAIDKFNADHYLIEGTGGVLLTRNRYPYSFSELRWSQETGLPYLRKSPPINPFASSNQAWIIILTNSQYGLESMTLEEFNTTDENNLINPDNKNRKEIYDIQFPPSAHPSFKYQISIYTSLEGTAYSSW